jgi:hypothetical protein
LHCTIVADLNGYTIGCKGETGRLVNSRRCFHKYLVGSEVEHAHAEVGTFKHTHISGVTISVAGGIEETTNADA